jgi:hypothetical protein
MKMTIENWPKKSSILNILVCFFALTFKIGVEYFRGTIIYQYGAPTSLLVFYAGILFSFFNTISIIMDSKNILEIKSNLFWIFLSSLPFLYIFVNFSISFAHRN